MVPLRGWSMRGTRLMATAPGGHWLTTTYVAGLTAHGYIAPMVLDGAMNGEAFLAWITQSLTGHLSPGKLVIMDNLPAHKVKGVAEAIEATGAELVYLPPYSPDLNPIEMSFSKLKTIIRRGQWTTKEDLWNGIGQAINRITEKDSRNYFRHIGYRSRLM